MRPNIKRRAPRASGTTSYDRMKKRELDLQEEVRRRLAEAEAADAAADAEFGRDKRGDELPEWVAEKKARIA